MNMKRCAAERLDPLLAGKSMVFLGEPDHFIHKKNEYRTRMIRYLAGHGFRNIGMEMGVSDAIRMDAFLADGDQAHLDRVALYGFPDEQRTDRDDSIPGFTDDKHPSFDQAAEAESRRFLASLRELNATVLKDGPRLSWFGYDISFKPGGGYADIAAALDRMEPTPEIETIRSRLARAEGESRLEEAERL
ncbi:MAG: hypothetical protein IFK94_05155, partial [Acidobacteria bacterium]|nr:hypothetical protein [Candidatus Polarisedimenticola svalbardensis]